MCKEKVRFEKRFEGEETEGEMPSCRLYRIPTKCPGNLGTLLLVNLKDQEGAMPLIECGTGVANDRTSENGDLPSMFPLLFHQH